MSKTTSVGEDFPKQQERIRHAVQAAKEIGPAGTFYVMMGNDLLLRAEEAVASGDVVRILAVYQEMREWKE